jgi:hypothetical protein
MKKVIPLFVATFLCLFLTGQDFEALDHHSLSNETVKVIPYNSGLILIQSELDDTHINYLKEDGEILRLYKIRGGEYFDINPSGIISNLESNGSITIYLTNLWEWDIYTGIIYKVNFDGMDSQVEELRPRNFHSFSDILIIDSSLHVLTKGSELFKYENSTDILIRRDFSFSKFYDKSNGHVYCFNADSLVSFNRDFGLSFDTLTKVHDIIEDSSGSNIVLAINKIQKYNADFTQKIWSFDIPDGHTIAKTIKNKGDDIYIGLKANNQKCSIWKVNDNGINPYFESLNTNFYEVHFVDSFQYLIGYHTNRIGNTIISTNTLVNKSSVSQAIQEDYDYIDIELSDIYVERRALIWSNSIDSTYSYDVRFTAKNNSEDTINAFSLFLNYYPRGGIFTFYDNEELEIDTVLLPGESLTFEKTGSWISNQLDPLKFVIPGANYKRDDNFSNNVKEVSVVINTNKNLNLKSIDIFPNPVINELHLVLPEAQLNRFIIYNINGAQVMGGPIQSSKLHVEHLDQGMYIINLASKDGGLFHSKFIKH